MRLKRFLSLLVTFVLVLGLCPVGTFAAENPYVQVVADKATPKVGEEVTFSVNLKNFNSPHDNVSSFEVKLGFDKESWEGVSDKVEFGDYIKSLRSTQYEMPVNTVNAANGLTHFGLSVYKSDNVTYFSGDGTLFTFKLKAKKDGLTDIKIDKSLFVQISKPGINITHGKGMATVHIGGETPPPPPPIDNGGGTGGGTIPTPIPTPPIEIIPIYPADVDRSETKTVDGKTKENIKFADVKAVKTVEQAMKSKSKAIEIKSTQPKEADFISISVASDIVSLMARNNIYLIISSEKGTMELPVELLKDLKKDLQIDLSYVTETSKQEEIKKQIAEKVKNGNSVSKFVSITTNYTGKTNVILPMPNLQTDKEVEAYLKTLGVFVAHTNGNSEYLKGEIQYDKDAKPVGISVLVEQFSLFTIVSDLFVKQIYTDDKAISAYAYESVYKAQELGIMTGSNGEFGPAKNLTRAQFTKIILGLLGEEPTSQTSKTFKDVSADHWAHGYIMKAVELGIVKGSTPDTFNPNATITREQVALMIGRAFKMQDNKGSVTYKDEAKISKEALPYVKVLHEKGIMKGYNDLFNPKDKVTREMAAVIAIRLLEQ